MVSRTQKPTPLTPWAAAVKKAVCAIPRGQTASYATVALMAGKPGAARAVVRALHGLTAIPWWRVVRSDRTLAPEVAVEQARRLRREGVNMKGRKVVALALT
jgi:methylated-DNA-protein-cysteine methyltransferase related protein